MAESLTSAQTQWCKSCCLTVHCTDFFIDCEFIERGVHSYQIEIAKKNTTSRLLTLAGQYNAKGNPLKEHHTLIHMRICILHPKGLTKTIIRPPHTSVGQVYQSWWKPTSMKYSLVYSLENLLHCWRTRNLPWITIICFTNRPKTHIQVLQTKVFVDLNIFRSLFKCQSNVKF